MEAYKMRIEYNRFFDKLKANGITQKEFKEKAKISSSTLAKLLHNETITTDTICKICDYFQCMPEDIMEWIPDADYEDKRKVKEEIQAEMERLQAKLKKLQKKQNANIQHSKYRSAILFLDIMGKIPYYIHIEYTLEEVYDKL